MNSVLVAAGFGNVSKRFSSIVVVCLTIAGLAGPAMGQDPESDDVDRTRFGAHIGAGYTSISTSEDTGVFGEATSTPDDMTVGLSFAFDFGYLTKRNTYLELAMSFWTGTLEGALGGEEWMVGVFGGALRWYPTGDGFYTRGGFGGGWINSTLKEGDGATETEFDDYGLGLLAGIGYELPVTDQFVSGPRLDVIFVDVGDNVRALGFNLLFTFSWI